jgi:hypothetical protein
VALLHHKDELKLMERLEKGSNYYAAFLKEILKKLLVHAAEVERFSKTKKYLEGLSEIEIISLRKLGDIQKVTLLIPAILNGEEIGKMTDFNRNLVQLRILMAQEAKQAAKENSKFSSTKTGRKKKEDGVPKIKLEKGETYEITYDLSRSGKSILEIVTERGLAESTIKGHLAKGIAAGKVSIHNHLSDEEIMKISKLIESENGELGTLRQKFPDLYDFGTLRMVAAYIGQKQA